MNQARQHAKGLPPEIDSIDIRIVLTSGTSAKTELQPHRLRQEKNHVGRTLPTEMEDLIRENNYLRQEIAFYKESRIALLAFYNQTIELFQTLQSALKELSENIALAEGKLKKYWGIPLNGSSKSDLIIL